MSSFDDPRGAMPPPDPEPDDAGEVPVPEPDEGGETEAERPTPEAQPATSPWRAEQLDRRVVAYWLFSGLIGWLFLALFLGAGAAFTAFQWPVGARVVIPAVITLLALLLVWTVISPSLAYNRWWFRVDAEILHARYGILYIEEKAIPISRLQHVDLYRGLIERFLGLTTLIVFTAGTEGAHFRLPGLSVGRAQELRDAILAARGDDVV